MNKSDVQGWLDAYGRAWVAGDPAALVALFGEDARYQETPFDAPMEGANAIRAYWQAGAADAQEDVSFSSDVGAVEGDVAFALWRARFRRVPSGAWVELDGTFRLVFKRGEDGSLKCLELREWWHRRES